MFFQGMSGKMALAVSLAVAGFVMIAENSECIHAQAICQVGSDPTFTQPIKITGTGSNTATLSAANLTASRTLTFPDADGALLAGTLTNNAPFISVSALGALDSSSTLTASTPLKSTALGQITAADLVPENDLTVGSGTANQILSVDGTGTALVFRNETTPSYTANAPYIKVDAAGAADSSSTLTANSPCLKADANGQIEACPSLTNSTPLKASATGQIEATDLDPINDLTNGSGTALQQLRVNSAANSLEFFTPLSGGAYTLIDSGTIIANPTSSDEVFTCWYGNTLDSTKKYKLIFDGGTGLNVGSAGYIPSYVPIEGDCSTLGKQEWEANSYYGTAQTHVGARANSDFETYGNRCYTVQGADSNNTTTAAANIQGHIQFSAVDNGNDYGFWSEYKMSAVATNSSGVISSVGIQWVTGSCLVWEQGYTNPFSDITGFMHYFEGGFPAPLTRKWALYEVGY